MATPPLPFPTTVGRSKDELERQFYRCVDTRCADASYHFSVLLPYEWLPLDTPALPPAEDAGLASLATYRECGLMTAEVEVGACILPREVAPAHWLELYLESLGAEIVARRDRETEGGLVADILARTDSADGPLITRWLTRKNYNRLFVAQGRALEPNYPRAAEAIFLALTNLTLLRPIDWPLAERLRTFSRREPGDFLLMVPESWTPDREPPGDPHALALTFEQRIDEVVVGRLAFATVARAVESDPQAIADRYAGDLRRAGVALDGLALAPGEPMQGFERTWQTTAVGALAGAAMEVRVWMGQRPDAWFFAGLLGPSRATQPEIWAVDTRALEILLQYLKVPDATG